MSSLPSKPLFLEVTLSGGRTDWVRADLIAEVVERNGYATGDLIGSLLFLTTGRELEVKEKPLEVLGKLDIAWNAMHGIFTDDEGVPQSFTG